MRKAPAPKRFQTVSEQYLKKTTVFDAGVDEGVVTGAVKDLGCGGDALTLVSMLSAPTVWYRPSRQNADEVWSVLWPRGTNVAFEWKWNG
eukprot:2001187-Amphidinium_carterae.1